jgi:hypothetical protein
VNVRYEYSRVVSELDLDLSAIIRERIGYMINQERELQKVECDPGDVVAEYDRTIIDLVLTQGPDPKKWK